MTVTFVPVSVLSRAARPPFVMSVAAVVTTDSGLASGCRRPTSMSRIAVPREPGAAGLPSGWTGACSEPGVGQAGSGVAVEHVPAGGERHGDRKYQ